MASEGRGVLDLFSWVLQKASPTVNEGLQLVSAAILMTFRQIYFLPVVEGLKVIGRFDGEHVVGALEKVRDSGIWRLVARKVGEVCDRKVPQVNPKDSLAALLDSMNKARFGHGCIVNDGDLVAVISLRDIVQYLVGLKVKTGVKVGEIARPIIGLPPEATVTRLVETLLTKRIRRIVVKGSEQLAIIDDRILAQHAFSHEGLLAMRHTSKMFFERPLSSLASLKPGTIKGESDVAEAWPVMYENPAECLILETGDKIITPWDAVMKLYTLGKFPSVALFASRRV